MEKDRKIKVLSLFALLVAVLGLTVAFAALSQTLTINGSAMVNTASWDVHFEKINSVPGVVIEGTSISNLNLTVEKPDDYDEYDFYILNVGTINAKIDSIEKSELCTLQSPVESCDWDNDGTVTQTDIDKVNDNISLTFFYLGKDDTVLSYKKGDIINSGDKITGGVRLDYNKVSIDGGEPTITESTELPKRKLEFSNLNIRINYVQAD
ncbi:MAG: hypothetical protein ACLUD7_02235 [Lachnospiraceae bacterium]|jgi:hypothetical protein